MWEKLKFHLPLAFISITTGVLLLMFRQFLLDANFSYKVGVILGFIAAVLFLFGVCLILIFWRTKLHNPSQVVISSIPDEDLENFPAPILLACERRRISGCHWFHRKQPTAGNTSAFAGYDTAF